MSVSLSGMVSGLDWEALVEKLMAIDRQPLLDLESRQKTIDEKRNAWKDVNTRLYNLQQKAEALKNRTTFYSMKATSSDTEIVTATATSAVPAGSYTVEVVRLARAHTVASSVQVSSTAALGITGNPVINGKEISITASDSLVSIRDKINATPDIGVQASVVQVSPTEYRLVLTSKETGSDKAITFSDDGGALLGLGILVDDGTIHANTIQDATDAEVKVNSLTITRATNTITDAVAGLTLQLKEEGETATVTVSTDTQKAVDAIKAFVDQYNSAMDFIASKTSYDKETKTAGPLLGDSTITQIQSMLRRRINARVPGMPVTMDNVGAIGIAGGAFGTSDANKLVLDEAKLKEKLESNLDDVAKLFGATQTNVALSTAGATASALDGSGLPNEGSPSSVYGALNAINGDILSDRWGSAGGGWMDATAGTYPDILEIDFGAVKTIDQVNIWTLNSTTYPSSTYGIKDYTLQYYDGAAWVDIESVTGNTAGMKMHMFDPVNTQKIRVSVSATNGANDYSRIVEVEALQYNEGIGSSIFRSLREYTRSGGILPEKQKALDAEKKRITDRIETTEARLALREANLKKQFVAMEAAISRLKNQSDWLTAQINQMSQTT
ncbi:MAG: flagellar filament capping protein FliD [Ignavibacteriales bacterium]